MRGRRHKLQVSTFPFLAVLLCTMGSLILVLLVMDRKAHKAAQARAQREAARLLEERARRTSLLPLVPGRSTEPEQKHMLQEQQRKRDALHEKWTREQLELQLQMRKIREEMQKIAARLHYEQDTTTQLRRQVQEKRSQLQAEEQLLQTLRTNAQQAENQSKESSQALRRMTLDLLQMEQVLRDLKASKQREQKTFSVVPYHGRRGENRRPIYVECTADGVVFHPERKAMPLTALIPRSDDSSSDVRVEVERRIAQQRQKLAGLPEGDKTPYLLLLLRPSGVTTYHLFQRALRGLPLDFGYEFIDEDWVLDFPADDELPSTQPWMIATKTPARPSGASPLASAPPLQTIARPMSGAPMGNASGASTGGIRGFRAGEPGGSGMKGSTNTSGWPPYGTGESAYALAGSQSQQNRKGPLLAQRSSQAASAGGNIGPSRDEIHGHPSAKPPTFPNSEGEMDYPESSNASGTGGGKVSENSYRDVGNLFRLYGSGSGPSAGFPTAIFPESSGSNSPELGPPRALSSGPGERNSATGKEQGSVAGIGSMQNNVPNNGWNRTTAGTGAPGPASERRTSPEGRYVIARGNNGDAPGFAAPSRSPESLGALTPPRSPEGTLTQPGSPQALGALTLPRSPGESRSPSEPRSSAGPSSETVIFVDPLTGQPTTNPYPASAPSNGSAESSPPERKDSNRSARRIRVVPAVGAANGDSAASEDNESSAMNHFAPTPSLAPPPRRLTASRPAWVHGGRDWTIYVECRADDLILYPSQQKFSLAQAIREPASNPLIKAIQQMIDRRQSSRRPDEPLYHPQVCLLVRPEHIRTFLTVYPALDALPVPKTRRNLDADDDVFSIVTGAVP